MARKAFWYSSSGRLDYSFCCCGRIIVQTQICCEGLLVVGRPSTIISLQKGCARDSSARKYTVSLCGHNHWKARVMRTLTPRSSGLLMSSARARQRRRVWGLTHANKFRQFLRPSDFCSVDLGPARVRCGTTMVSSFSGTFGGASTRKHNKVLLSEGTSDPPPPLPLGFYFTCTNAEKKGADHAARFLAAGMRVQVA